MISRRGAVTLLLSIVAALMLAAPAAKGASHSADSALIEVRSVTGETLPESVAQRIKGIDGVSAVEKYLWPDQPGPVQFIGVEPGAPLRIFTPDGRHVVGRLAAGRAFREAEAGRNVALVNRVSIAGQDDMSGGDMTGMVHSLGVGQSVIIGDTRFRVVGEVAAPTDQKMFLTLAAAQRLHGLEGRLTHVFVRVEDAGKTETIREAIAELLGPEFTAVRR